MAKEDKSSAKKTPVDKLGQAIQGLLDRLKEDTQEMVDFLGGRRSPVLQPIPVRRPVYRPKR